MLLSEDGLKLAGFHPALARILGSNPGEEGGQVLSETVIHGRSRVQLRDWLYALARAPGSLVATQLIVPTGSSPDRFVELIEGAFESDPDIAIPPRRLTSTVVTDDVTRMLEAAEQIGSRHGNADINEAMLASAILDIADGSELGELLKVWAKEDKIQRFRNLLKNRLTGAPKDVARADLFDGQRRLDLKHFSPSGRALCRRLREDAASLGARKISARHLLYTLLSLESSALFQGLVMRGQDVKRDIHPTITRLLSRPGAKRNRELELTEESLLGTVAEIFVRAANSAQQRGEPGITEIDVSRAFIHGQQATLKELLPQSTSLDLAGLTEYLDSIEPDQASEQEQPLQRLSIAEMESAIKERIRGQPMAVDRLMPWVKRLRFGLSREDRPACVLLFMGPTGVGKTQLAKELARHVYGGEEMLLFLEMGQYHSKESMNNFVGAPAGFVGYGEGKLTNGLRDKPECVVLFDEIEKADVQVFNALLRFADEGRISDPAGPERDGRRCIIVMTTNAGQEWLQEVYLKIKSEIVGSEAVTARLSEIRRSTSFCDEFIEAARKELSKKGFQPEFIGRVDELITFFPMDLETCGQIVDDVLEREALRLHEAKGIALVAEDQQARKILAKKALERSLREGARAVPRVVNELIVNRVIDLATGAEERGEPLTSLHVVHRGVDVDVEP